MIKEGLATIAAGVALIAGCDGGRKATPDEPDNGNGSGKPQEEKKNEDDNPTTADTVSSPARPNVIVILADDMGYSDVGCYGSEIDTPNIDALAARGIRYRTFYNAARSAPTRASLLTGLYPHEAGCGALTAVAGYDHYTASLRDDNCTIPEALESAGYFSFITGKWHLKPEKCMPLDRGFDHSVHFGGGWYWSDDSKNSNTLYLEDVKITKKSADNGLPGGNEAWYTSDMFVTMGLKWIDEAIGKDKPFFWYMPFNAVHYPIQAKKETIGKYTGKYAEGYTTVRNRRFENQVRLGLFEQGQLTAENPHPDFKHWDRMTQAEKTVADKRMAIYAACVEDMDTNIGRIISHLEQKGILDNTIIFFLADNGANAESGWPGTYDTGTAAYPGAPGESKSHIYEGAPWAGVSNTPFYLYKHQAHNGGCCTPFIVSWPDGIDKSLNGTIDKVNYGHVVDLMPTILELTGGRYPATHRAKDGKTYTVQAMEGTSLTPSFSGRTISRNKPIIVEHEGHKMLRDGEWKIVREFEFSSGTRQGTQEASETQNPWRLYHVSEDPSEMHDVSAQYPDIARKLISTYKTEAARTFVASDIVWKVGGWYTPVRDFPIP